MLAEPEPGEPWDKNILTFDLKKESCLLCSPVIDIAGSGACHGLQRDIDGLSQGGGGGDIQRHH